MPNLFGISRIYQRLAHKLGNGAAFYRHIRHFTSPRLLADRLRRHRLTLEAAHYFDHPRCLGLPAPLTEELFVAVCRKD
jgi:hypothetical protein